MTAGLSVRGHEARISATTSIVPGPISGATAITATTALPATGFTVPAIGIQSLIPLGPDRPISPPEGEIDTRTMIDTLVAGAVGGDARARDDLLALIHPLVLKYCRARLGRQESLMGSADDVAQDVCMAVVGALPNYQLKGLSFRAFVYGIAAHKVTDAFRAIGRNRAEPVAELPDGPVTADGPEHRLLAAEMSARLGRLLSHLTPRQREVLVLRLAVGLSAEETAQAVRSTPGAVRVTQHRALGRLRKILLGESGARGIAAAEGFRDEPVPVIYPDAAVETVETDETCAEPAGLEELDIDPDVAAADDSAIDAMAAVFFAEAEPEPVVTVPAPRRPTPYKRAPSLSC
jgi:RNA polymerase sigma-70 factor (ECF subfamily)